MVRRRSNRKPRFTSKESSLEQKQQNPTRKRGRPRKTVKQEENDVHGVYEEEQLEQNKKMKLETGLDGAGQHEIVVEEEDPSAAAAAAADAAGATEDVKKEQTQAEEVKPRSRGRRKSQPRKST